MKLSIKIALFVLIFLLSKQSFSENISIGYGLGCSIAFGNHKYSTPDSFMAVQKDIPSLLINTSVRYNFENQIFIQSDIQLFEISSDYTITEQRKEGEYKYWSNLDIHLIQMPLLIGYSLFNNKKVTLNPCIGGFWGIPISEKQKYINDRGDIITLKSERFPLDFGICSKINFSIKFGDYILGVNTAYYLPINKHKYNIYKNIEDKCKKSSLQLDCSLMFNF